MVIYLGRWLKIATAIQRHHRLTSRHLPLQNHGWSSDSGTRVQRVCFDRGEKRGCTLCCVTSHIRMAEQTNGNTLEGLYKELHSGGKDEPALCRPVPEPEVAAEVKMDGDRLVMSVDDWTTRWEQGKTGFHNENRHVKLVRYLDDLVKGRKELKFFFPLCGKTVDMKWMYDEGHTVVGVEASIKAVEEFFLDNDITYIADSVDAIEGFVYKSPDDRIRIYCCDLYKFTPDVEKDFTAFFDRGALVAINKEDRVRYANLMMSLMAPDARYMLLTFDYDPSKYPGPPHYLSIKDIEELYGSKCTLNLINVEDAFEPRHEKWGITTLEERVHVITFKQ